METEPVLSRKPLLKTLEDRAEVIDIKQNRPFTCVTLRSWYNDREYIGFGFSKVMYPDKWDCEVGADIAHRRALLMIYHQVRASERGKRRMEAWDSLIKTEVFVP